MSLDEHGIVVNNPESLQPPIHPSITKLQEEVESLKQEIEILKRELISVNDRVTHCWQYI